MSTSPLFEKVAECLYRNPSIGTYYALAKVKGKPHKRSLKTTDLAEAKRKLRDYRAEVEVTPWSGQSHRPAGVRKIPVNDPRPGGINPRQQGDHTEKGAAPLGRYARAQFEEIRRAEMAGVPQAWHKLAESTSPRLASRRRRRRYLPFAA